MTNTPTENLKENTEQEIEITDNFVKFYELLIKVADRLDEQKRKETLS